MTIRYISGLDWSGDLGDPNRQPSVLPGFAVAIASAQREDISTIEERLSICRQGLGHGPSYVFHFKESDSRTREQFFGAMQGLPYQ